jgi:hypothetical protein
MRRISELLARALGKDAAAAHGRGLYGGGPPSHLCD